ncbi:MAG: phosphoribosyltransferase family protein, partial [Candidatus Margulisbacteria bacterium]|nr:phosphoribosyltransferase family protein [Candidatus Margulisiibacteriota bacterium]
LHHKRFRARGFNQAARLAQVIGKYYEKQVTEALARMRDTHSQFDLPREKRLTNVSGAFKVIDSRSVFGQRVMLVDDIYTTGATIAECSRALKVAGAKRIEVLTLSRAVED